METISLSSSPAALITADDAEDDGDEAAPVRFHEAASDGADDDEAEAEAEHFPRKTSYYGANYCARLPGTALCFLRK